METDYNWEEKTLDSVENVRSQGGEVVDVSSQEVKDGKEEGGYGRREGEKGGEGGKEKGRKDGEEVEEKRMSLEDDQFVDALQSPVRDKASRDWDTR